MLLCWCSEGGAPTEVALRASALAWYRTLNNMGCVHASAGRPVCTLHVGVGHCHHGMTYQRVLRCAGISHSHQGLAPCSKLICLPLEVFSQQQQRLPDNCSALPCVVVCRRIEYSAMLSHYMIDWLTVQGSLCNEFLWPFGIFGGILGVKIGWRWAPWQTTATYCCSASCAACRC